MKNGRPEEATSMLPISKGHFQKAEITSVRTKPRSWYGVRHTQIVLLFLLVVIAYGMRVNMSVGIVAMTDPTTNPNFPTYNWTMKSTILSSFFWGYVIPQIGVGQLAERYGPKWFLASAMTVSALFTVLIPVFAELGAWSVMVCRILQGFTQGFFYPCIHNLLSRWIPLQERSRMGTFVYAGGPFGTVIAMPVTGWISASSIGWPSVFYIYGTAGFVWALAWVWIGENDPSDHKTISEDEKMFIQKSCGDNSKSDKKMPTPWLQFFKSLPVWSLFITQCGQNWGFSTLLTQIPTYMNAILNFNISDNGLLSAAPYLALWLLSFFFSSLTDMFINRKIFSVAVARKIVTAIGLVGPSIALFCLAMIESGQKGPTIGLLIAAVGINSAVFCGFQVNHIDIAPSYAGTLIGITNGCGNIVSIIAPLLVEVIVSDETNPDQWKIVFFTASAIYVASCMVYTVLGKGEIQYWDKAALNNLEEGASNEKHLEAADLEKSSRL